MRGCHISAPDSSIMQVQERRCIRILSNLLCKCRHTSISWHLGLTVPLEFVCACPARARTAWPDPGVWAGISQPKTLSKWQSAVFLPTRWKKEKIFKENWIYNSNVHIVKNPGHFISVWLQDNLFRLLQPVKRQSITSNHCAAWGGGRNTPLPQSGSQGERGVFSLVRVCFIILALTEFLCLLSS